jgi:hypothetical protein
MVWLSGKNLRTKQLSIKLDHRFYRPYQVIECVSMQVYHLKLLQEVGNIYGVFHVSLLEPYVSNPRDVPEPLRTIELDGQEEYELVAVLQSGYRCGVYHYLVKYKRYRLEESEWLLAENLTNAQDIVHKFH